MVNKNQKGNYHRLKTRKWLEGLGYAVEYMEHRQRIVQRDRRTGEDRAFYVAHDIWGADIAAMNGEELIFVQVKANAGDVAKGMKELAAHPYPPCVSLWVVHWPHRAREPQITEVESGARELVDRNV